MSTADTTAWRQRAERCDDRIRELRAEMARRDEQIAAVQALLDEWEEASGAMVESELGGMIRQVSAHPYRQGVQDVIDDVRASLDGGAS